MTRDNILVLGDHWLRLFLTATTAIFGTMPRELREAFGISQVYLFLLFSVVVFFLLFCFLGDGGGCCCCGGGGRRWFFFVVPVPAASVGVISFHFAVSLKCGNVDGIIVRCFKTTFEFDRLIVLSLLVWFWLISFDFLCLFRMFVLFLLYSL